MRSNVTCATRNLIEVTS